MPFNWTSEQSLTIDQIHAIFIGCLNLITALREAEVERADEIAAYRK